MLPKLVQLDKKFIFALSVAFVFGGITIYDVFIFERKPHIQYHILSDSNVLDVHAEVSKLDITYNGISIKKANKNLRIITLRVINSGNSGILQQDYASTDPLGMKLTSGDLVEKPVLLKASSHYLEKNIAFELKGSRTILLPNLIFDPDEYVEIKLLVLHDKKVKPEILPLGKIANMAPPEIIRTIKGERSEIRTIFERVGISLITSLIGALVVFAVTVGLRRKGVKNSAVGL